MKPPFEIAALRFAAEHADTEHTRPNNVTVTPPFGTEQSPVDVGALSGIEPAMLAAVRFLVDSEELNRVAYAGPRLNEAKHILGRDCNFTKGEIIIRGDAETGTKNWEIRRVPMIPEMRKLLQHLKEKRGEEGFLNSPVCRRA